jgi:hypothetical protein
MRSDQALMYQTGTPSLKIKQRLDKLRWQLVLTFALLEFTTGMSESCDCHKET